jgi:hypothetical protein
MCTRKEDKIRWHGPNTRDTDVYLSVGTPHRLSTCREDNSANTSLLEVTERSIPKIYFEPDARSVPGDGGPEPERMLQRRKASPRLYLPHLWSIMRKISNAEVIV